MMDIMMMMEGREMDIFKKKGLCPNIKTKKS
jgi:hypothetical protein